MLKYLYKNNNNKTSVTTLAEQKIINDNYTNKFYIRSSVVETKEILILDNHYKFFLLNKKNIEKHLQFFKDKNLLGKALQVKEFIYSKHNYFKINFFIGNRVYNFNSPHLKTLFLIQKNLKTNMLINWPLLLINRGNFIYIFSGLKGFLPRKNFGQLRKVLKKFKKLLATKQKFLVLITKYKKLVLKSLLIKNLKANKLFLTRSRYKNQLIKNSSFFKNKKLFSKVKN